MDRQTNITLAKRNLVDSIWKEANIEGIAVTFPETKEIFEGRTVSNLSVDETIAINNLKHAWKFILETLDVPIDIPLIKQINQEVGNRIINDCGNIRQSVVTIGGTEWKPEIPDYDTIKNNLNYLLHQEKNEVTAMELFMYLCRTQTFIDGNKRTAQLVANKYLIENGLGIFSIKPNDKLEFETKLIEYYETNDMKELKKFLINNCLFNDQKTKNLIQTKSKPPKPVRGKVTGKNRINQDMQDDKINKSKLFNKKIYKK